MYDIVVIGGGPAGLVTAAGSSGLGANVALIERDRLGGDCLWTGCVPSKALIASARLAKHFREAEAFGLPAVTVDLPDHVVMESVRNIRARIQVHDDPERFRAMGVNVVEGSARFVTSHEVEVGDQRIRGRRFLIATGSRPAVPPIEGLAGAGYFTHAEAFDRDTIPATLAVIGGGPIGVELAQAFQRLGSDVTIIETLDRIMAREEPELTEHLTKQLKQEGIRILTGHVATRVDRRGTQRSITIKTVSPKLANADVGSQKTEILEVDEILVATGRLPNTEGLGLETVGIKTENGWLTVDSKLRTSEKHVFGAGDVTGRFLFTHVADHQARTVVQNALFPVRTNIKYDVIPWCTFTDPELAHVGMTEHEARDQYGSEVSIHLYDLADLDRVIVDRAPVGCVKIVTRRGGRILGGHILGPNAGTMISEIALAMEAGVRLGSISSLVHPYPTMSEGVRRTADAYRRSQLTGWKKSLLEIALRVGRVWPA